MKLKYIKPLCMLLEIRARVNKKLLLHGCAAGVFKSFTW